MTPWTGALNEDCVPVVRSQARAIEKRLSGVLATPKRTSGG